jgi:rRNA processing protein Gar1
MAVEMFGPVVAPYAAIACVVSFLMTGHRSVYPSQVLSMSKSTSITVQKGREMCDIEGVDVMLKRKSIIGVIAKMWERGRRNKTGCSGQ